MKKLLFILPILLLVGCGNAQATNNTDVVEETKKVVESTTKVSETTKVVETTKEEVIQNKLSDDLQAFVDEIEGIDKDKMFKEFGYDEDRNSKLADAGYYWYYSMDDNIVKVMSYDEVVNIIQNHVNANEGNMGLNNVTKEIYDKLKNKKSANDAKVEQQNISALVVRLQAPKTVDQIGGNKVGDNAGMYKGQIQQPRKYGTTPYPGSGLFACNSLLGENAENYYECRNGFVVLKADGFKIFDKLTGKDRGQFSKTEWEVFKINNPNIKIARNDYVSTYDYGTFEEGGNPLWLEGVNQCVVNCLGQSLFQTGRVIDGVLTAERGYATGCSNPSVVNADGTFNQAYTDEVNAFWHDSSRDHSQEAQNALIRKYMK